jgi:hydroxyethylthiazole kinase-like uncharacterized protein yjeF
VIPVLDARAMRAADAETIRGGVASGDLMENAAGAVCRELVRAFPGWKRVVVVCGPGNNGGDGLAVARLLAGLGLQPAVFTLKDPAAYEGDPASNVVRAKAHGLGLVSLAASPGFAALRRALTECDGIVDALFGTGLTRALTGSARRAVAAIGGSDRPVVSVDVPSGLATDSGIPPGPAVRASLTVALGAPKPCHLFPPASGLCGRVLVADIGIARATLERRARNLWLAEASDVATLLPARPLDSHKATFGRLAVIAGSRGKTGAAVLAARGALRAGVGLVTVLCAASLEPIVVEALPEAMTLGLPEENGAIAAAAAGGVLRAVRGFDAAIAGPGLGVSAGTVAVLEALVGGSAIPIVADADCLNAFSGRPAAFAKRRASTVLTPHPGEAGRLLGRTARQVQADRLEASRALARRSRAVVVLKGAHSLIASPEGRTLVNPTGTPLLATAGSGDVLAGLIGALLAAGLDARSAAMAGVFLHGAAAEALEPRLGDAGLLAHEVADAVPFVRRALRLGVPGEPECATDS